MVREFEGHRTYRKGEYMTPECYVHEIRRMICDKNAIPQRAYYWGLYKQKTYRWINGYINKSGWYTDYSGMVYGNMRQGGFRFVQISGGVGHRPFFRLRLQKIQEQLDLDAVQIFRHKKSPFLTCVQQNKPHSLYLQQTGVCLAYTRSGFREFS